MVAPTEFDTRTTTIQRPAPFIEAAGTAFTKRLTPLLDPARATKIDPLYQAPAAQNVLAQQGLQRAATAAGLGDVTFGGPGGTISAVQPGTGVAAFEPFLAESQRLAGVDPATGQVTTAGMEAALQPFMSPFQQQVIDATTAAFENRRAQERLNIADQAIAAGAFGGARQGVQEGVFDAQTSLGIAALEADLRQQGLAAADAARTAESGIQMQRATEVPGLRTQQLTSLQQLGAGQQALEQQQSAILEAQARERIFDPQQRMGAFAQSFAPLVQGIGPQSVFRTDVQPPPNPLDTIIGVGGVGAGLLGGLGSILGAK